ncbi:MAG: hypothetical protein HY785_04260 [Oscillatoriophycideae cyanobacterium NC_groundwater_1537_Pr4_S-0.65um_50_18]|nr:hypothetical protein [Oscillatoriophycideae cyanobacterium NC_groundwater_1537_Pr4_S-0.65um_50_18]
MNHYCLTWIENWCFENGWTEPFVERRNEFWAFPPNGVMPVPIPSQALQMIKQEHGLTIHEKVGCWAAIGASVVAIASTYLLDCPMPLVAAFGICAVIVAGLETEDK